MFQILEKNKVKFESFKLGEIRIDEVKKFKAFSLQRYIKSVKSFSFPFYNSFLGNKGEGERGGLQRL